MSIRERSADAYRERVFAWNREHARWGSFPVDPTPGEHGGEEYKPICGVCGLSFLHPVSKANHLEIMHNATVSVSIGPTGVEFYEWRR